MILLCIIPEPQQTVIATQEDTSEQVSVQVSVQVEETITLETQEILEVTTYSQNCIDLVKKYEGFRSAAYKCPTGHLTIGYGHTGDVKEGQTITEEQAEKLLIAELDGACEYVKKHCSYLDLNQNELDALTSFTYNGGLGMLQELTKNKTRSKEEIAEHIEAYTNGGMAGLIKRRNEELKLFKGEI